MFECTNCHGSGYFDTIDGGEVPCSVCHGVAEIDADAFDKAIAERDELREQVDLSNERLETAACALREVLDERDALREEVTRLQMSLAKQTSEKHAALMEIARLLSSE